MGSITRRKGWLTIYGWVREGMTQGKIIQYNRGWRGGIGRVIKTHVGGMEGQAATQHISTPCQHHKTTLTHHPTPLKLLTLLTNNTHGHTSTQTLLRTYQTPHEREILTGYLGSSYRAFPGFFFHISLKGHRKHPNLSHLDRSSWGCTGSPSRG